MTGCSECGEDTEQPDFSWGDGVCSKVIITLPDKLYAELQSVAEDVNEHGFTPLRGATEALEAALASRRLPRVSAAAK